MPRGGRVQEQSAAELKPSVYPGRRAATLVILGRYAPLLQRNTSTAEGIIPYVDIRPGLNRFPDHRKVPTEGSIEQVSKSHSHRRCPPRWYWSDSGPGS
jgi:hypothetical protein